MNKKITSIAIFIVLLIFLFLSSCAFNKTLAAFDLGENRVAKIVTGDFMDPSLPIYCQLFINGESVDKSVIEFEGTGEFSVVSKYRYQLLSDKSKKLFIIIQTAPESTFSPQAVFDFNEEFGYPVCPQKRCLDCHGGYCVGNSEMCIKKSNQIMEQIEKDNPNIKLTRYEWNAPKDCENSK